MFIVVECGMPHSITQEALQTLPANVYVNRVWFPDEDDEPIVLYKELGQRLNECADTYEHVEKDLKDGKSVIVVNGICSYLAAAETVGLQTSYAYSLFRSIEPDYTLLIETSIPAVKVYAKKFHVDETLQAKNALRWLDQVLHR